MFDWVGFEEMAAKAAGLDPALAGEADLLDAAVHLERIRALVDAAEAHVLARLDADEVTDRRHGLRTATWLAREAKLPAGVARARVKVATRLADTLPEADDALVDGRLSWHHAHALAERCHPRVAESMAAVHPQLVALAQGTVFEQWRRAVEGIVDLLDEDGGHDPARDLARNHLSLSRTFGGVRHVEGTLTGEYGLIASQALEAKADELFLQFRADREHCPELEIPGRATLRALAFVELCRQGAAVDVESTRAPRPDVTLVVNAADPCSAHDPEGVPLQDGTVRTLLCDPDLRALVVDGLGVPLDLGRTHRYANAAQRRAMAQRDGGCVFPGCGSPAAWTDAHHLDEWHRDHGETNLDRLASLCRHHHRVTHRPGWAMHATADGWFWWTTPAGQCIGSQRHRRQRAGPAPPSPLSPPDGELGRTPLTG